MRRLDGQPVNIMKTTTNKTDKCKQNIYAPDRSVFGLLVYAELVGLKNSCLLTVGAIRSLSSEQTAFCKKGPIRSYQISCIWTWIVVFWCGGRFLPSMPNGWLKISRTTMETRPGLYVWHYFFCFLLSEAKLSLTKACFDQKLWD